MERGKQDQYCNSPHETGCYFELLVVAVYGDPIEMNLNSILLVKQTKLVGELSFLSDFYVESAYFINCRNLKPIPTLFSIITSVPRAKSLETTFSTLLSAGIQLMPHKCKVLVKDLIGGERWTIGLASLWCEFFGRWQTGCFASTCHVSNGNQPF